MNILLTQSTLYVPAWGGANKSNRVLLEELALRGHVCRAVVPGCGVHGYPSRELLRSELRARALRIERAGPDADIFHYNGVRVTAAAGIGSCTSCLVREIREFDPDWVLVASEDLGQMLLATALKTCPSRVVYVARTTFVLPFGPASAVRLPGRVWTLRQAAGIVVASQYLKDYLRRWAGLESEELPISLCGPGPFPKFGRFDSGFVMFVNPCEYKGISIFLGLANALPHTRFAAVPTWGTTERDRRLLAATGNVTLLDPVEDVDRIFAVTRVLLVPSVCAEGKSNLITEAMLRGIPVLASDVGGNAEAMLKLDYLLPVEPITKFRQEVDEKMLPLAVVPEQNLLPWLDALRTVIENRECYESLSARSRRAAVEANAKQTIVPFEEYLMHLQPRDAV